jgi:hypothetical protein
MRKKIALLSLILTALILGSSIMAYSNTPTQNDINLAGLTREEFDELYQELLGEAEEDASRPRWLVVSWGRSWKVSPSTDEVQNTYRISMRLLATRVYITDTGYKLYELKGAITHDGNTLRVYGVAILNKDGCFCMKLDPEEPLNFRLFACGRVKPGPGHGILRLGMKGGLEMGDAYFRFVQKGYAIRIRIAAATETE